MTSSQPAILLSFSDLDIVLLREGGLLKSDLSRLASHLRRSGIANDITVISKARVPLVKFKESITGIPVDISFNITNGIDSGQVISAFINEIPALRPLTMLVKYFLMTKVKKKLGNATRSRDSDFNTEPSTVLMNNFDLFT